MNVGSATPNHFEVEKTISDNLMSETPSDKKFWANFAARKSIASNGVLLFDHSENLIVRTKKIGRDKREVLKRSNAMDKLILEETDKLVADWESGANEYDGIVYVMYLQRSDTTLPLYIGKAETLGKGEGNLSANIKGLHSSSQKFARWGDNYQYHIGDLSAVVLFGHKDKYQNNKYRDWASSLFLEFPTSKPTLKEPVYFWTTAWKKTETGPWQDFGATRLTFLEYLLIGIASAEFPEDLLNREGQNRG